MTSGGNHREPTGSSMPDTAAEDKVLCRTPTPGKKPTRIDAWKFEAVRRAMLTAIGRTREGMPFNQLPKLVERYLTIKERERLGSVSWYTTTVKLELEVRGEIERIKGIKPQQVRRV